MDKATKTFKSLTEFANGISERLNIHFVDEDFCRHWTLKAFHPSGPVCPYCGSMILDNAFVDKFYKGKSVQCPRCKKWFKATTDTFLEGSQLTFSQVVLMLVLIEMNRPTEAISKLIGVNNETVRRWRHRLKIEQKQKQLFNVKEIRDDKEKR